MRMSDAERKALSRRRRREGRRAIRLGVDEQVIDFLVAQDYDLKRTDSESIARAVSSLTTR
jgi:hypothetical protein